VGKPVQLVVLHQGAIGDFVLVLSVVQAVRSRVGAEHVAVIATAPSAKLAVGHSAIDAWQSAEQAALHTLFREPGPLDDRLASVLSAADWVLSFLSDTSGPVHQRLCASTTGRVMSIDPRPSEETLARRRHITMQWQAEIRERGLDPGDLAPPVIHLGPGREAAIGGREATCRAREAASRVGRDAGPRRVVVHPGSGGREKCWPIDRFVRLVESLKNVEVTWVLGPAECESQGEQTVVVRERVAATPESLLVEQDLCQAARRIAGADLYVGNDAGPTHVAAAMGIPTVAIFGPTDPQVWRPLGNDVAVAAPARRGDPITAVTVEQVNSAVQQILKLSY